MAVIQLATKDRKRAGKIRLRGSKDEAHKLGLKIKSKISVKWTISAEASNFAMESGKESLFLWIFKCHLVWF